MQASKEDKTSTTLVVGPKLILFTGVVLGLLLLTIGAGTHTGGVSYIGIFILALALFWGGLYSKEDHIAVRVALLVIGGIVAANGLLGLASITSLLGR